MKYLLLKWKMLYADFWWELKRSGRLWNVCLLKGILCVKILLKCCIIWNYTHIQLLLYVHEWNLHIFYLEKILHLLNQHYYNEFNSIHGRHHLMVWTATIPNSSLNCACQSNLLLGFGFSPPAKNDCLRSGERELKAKKELPQHPQFEPPRYTDVHKTLLTPLKLTASCHSYSGLSLWVCPRNSCNRGSCAHS